MKKCNDGFELLGGGNDQLVRQGEHDRLIQFSFEVRCNCYMFHVNECCVNILYVLFRSLPLSLQPCSSKMNMACTKETN